MFTRLQELLNLTSFAQEAPLIKAILQKDANQVLSIISSETAENLKKQGKDFRVRTGPNLLMIAVLSGNKTIVNAVKKLYTEQELLEQRDYIESDSFSANLPTKNLLTYAIYSDEPSQVDFVLDMFPTEEEKKGQLLFKGNYGNQLMLSGTYHNPNGLKRLVSFYGPQELLEQRSFLNEAFFDGKRSSSPSNFIRNILNSGNELMLDVALAEVYGNDKAAVTSDVQKYLPSLLPYLYCSVPYLTSNYLVRLLSLFPSLKDYRFEKQLGENLLMAASRDTQLFNATLSLYTQEEKTSELLFIYDAKTVLHAAVSHNNPDLEGILANYTQEQRKTLLEVKGEAPFNKSLMQFAIDGSLVLASSLKEVQTVKAAFKLYDKKEQLLMVESSRYIYRSLDAKVTPCSLLEFVVFNTLKYINSRSTSFLLDFLLEDFSFSDSHLNKALELCNQRLEESQSKNTNSNNIGDDHIAEFIQTIKGQLLKKKSSCGFELETQEREYLVEHGFDIEDGDYVLVNANSM